MPILGEATCSPALLTELLPKFVHLLRFSQPADLHLTPWTCRSCGVACLFSDSGFILLRPQAAAQRIKPSAPSHGLQVSAVVGDVAGDSEAVLWWTLRLR